MMRMFLLAGVLSLSFAAQAAVDQKASNFVICKHRKDVRTIRILPELEKADNCTVTYSKGSTEEVVGGNRNMKTCKSILRNIQSNLQHSSWSCRSVETARVLSSSEVIR